MLLLFEVIFAWRKIFIYCTLKVATDLVSNDPEHPRIVAVTFALASTNQPTHFLQKMQKYRSSDYIKFQECIEFLFVP